ncbi:MAG TPA: hypothetical protein VFI33_13360 [Puia sp.]|nr:hypothetical protein [Puia sp.]
MELDEMKILWEEMSDKISRQKKMTDSLIIRMTRSDFGNKLLKIWIPEAMGNCICFAAAVYIIVDFRKLDTWYLILCGIISVFILFILPVLSFYALHKIRSVNILQNNYKQTLAEYSKGNRQFAMIQKLSFYLGAVLLLTSLPVMGLLIAGKDLFIESKLWLWYAVGYPFFYGFSKWVFRNYSKVTREAEDILKELGD